MSKKHLIDAMTKTTGAHQFTPDHPVTFVRRGKASTTVLIRQGDTCCVVHGTIAPGRDWRALVASGGVTTAARKAIASLGVTQEMRDQWLSELQERRSATENARAARHLKRCLDDLGLAPTKAQARAIEKWSQS